MATQWTLPTSAQPWILPDGRPIPALYTYLLQRLGTGASTPANDTDNTWLGLNSFDGGLQIKGVNAVDLSSAQTLSNKSLEGVTSGGNAAAGIVGEYLSSVVLAGSAVGLSTGIPANVTALALQAGDYDVWGEVAFAPAGTTTIASLEGWISGTSATLPTLPNGGAAVRIAASFTTGAAQALPVGLQRATSSGPFTLYLSVAAGFGVSTMGAYGGLFARRVR